MDGGVVLSTLDGLHAGVCGRLLVTMGVISGYGRLGSIFGSPREGTYGELGILVKLPIPLDIGEGGFMRGRKPPPARPVQRQLPLPPEPPPPEEKPSMPVAI